MERNEGDTVEYYKPFKGRIVDVTIAVQNGELLARGTITRGGYGGRGVYTVWLVHRTEKAFPPRDRESKSVGGGAQVSGCTGTTSNSRRTQRWRP